MSHCIQQKAKRLTCCQIDSLSRWNRRQTVMWWACVSVGALRWALPGQTASLWLPVCVCVIVCGLCARVGASVLLCLSCLFMLQGLGEYRALLDPVTVSPLHPKPGPDASVVLPQRPLYMFAGFGFLIPDFNPTFTFLYCWPRFMAGWRLLSFKGWMHFDTSFGSDFSTRGTIKLSKSLSYKKRARKGQEERVSSNNACANQISQEWISCV